MKILLIVPASGEWRLIARQKTFDGKTFRFSVLSLLTLAALSPDDAEVRIIDEQIEEIPGPEEHFDLVGITAMTALAPRAYELCALFRSRGVPVVMGGFHATLTPQEALLHADAIVVGHAYGAWKQLCEDLRNGRLQRLYHGDASRGAPVHLPRHLLRGDRYLTVSSVFATLGCSNSCQFCSINQFHRCQRYERPVVDVVAEVEALPNELFVFVDDNLTQNRGYALELLHALAPLRRRWVVQASIEIADDAELLQAMREAGCIGVFIGLETFCAESLARQEKSFNKPQRYRQAVQTIHRAGMYVQAGVMVGFDADGPPVFRHTLRMLEWVGIDIIQLAIVTPLPGTPLAEAMRDRIVDHDWQHYDYRHAVFTPKRMTREELQGGADWLIRSFYKRWRIARRLLRWLAMPGGWRRLLYPIGLSLAYLGRVKRFNIRGFDPSRQPQEQRHAAIQAVPQIP